MPSRWSHERCCDLAEAEIERFASVVRGAARDTPIPTCGGWTLGDLVQHVGHIHRWAAGMVGERSRQRHSRRQADLPLPDPPADLGDWIAEGAEVLLPALRAADPDDGMWTWGPDKHVRFWSRRMVHETAVHRVDAQLGLGLDPWLHPAVAVDGVDEFLENPPARRFRGDGERILLAATDRPDRWLVSLSADRPVVSRLDADPAGTATVRVRGTAADLDLLLWQRRHHAEPRFAVRGDAALLDRWRAATEW